MIIKESGREVDDDLVGMYLTDKANQVVRDTEDHQDVELLLEFYLTHVEEIANTVTRTLHNMRATEDIVNIILDSQRNSLLVFELKLAMGTLGLTGGAMVAGFFGMNLRNGLELEPGAWASMVLISLMIAGTTVFSARRKMQQLVKRTI